MLSANNYFENEFVKCFTELYLKNQNSYNQTCEVVMKYQRSEYKLPVSDEMVFYLSLYTFKPMIEYQIQGTNIHVLNLEH